MQHNPHLKLLKLFFFLNLVLTAPSAKAGWVEKLGLSENAADIAFKMYVPRLLKEALLVQGEDESLSAIYEDGRRESLLNSEEDIDHFYLDSATFSEDGNALTLELRGSAKYHKNLGILRKLPSGKWVMMTSSPETKVLGLDSQDRSIGRTTDFLKSRISSNSVLSGLFHKGLHTGNVYVDNVVWYDANRFLFDIEYSDIAVKDRGEQSVRFSVFYSLPDNFSTNFEDGTFKLHSLKVLERVQID